jgi:Carboxypeptidase regulatory-like domain
MRNSQGIAVLCAAAFFMLLGAQFARTQDPASGGAAASPKAATNASSPSKPGKHNTSRANDFLIVGTVFTPQGLSFPDVRLRLRRSGEKKFRLETYTNSRGDFAVRVPRGAAYEILVQSKGFADQTRTVNTEISDTQDRVVFRMEPLQGEKK